MVAMNFFAGLLLLLMPKENAFRSLVGIIDDYFDGYYTEEMIESQFFAFGMCFYLKEIVLCYFRTALALMELYGPALVTSIDAVDISGGIRLS
ncbi:hypothetical protein DITRI_Ditri12bG0158200 [Diplodiscus trichospermus]